MSLSLDDTYSAWSTAPAALQQRLIAALAITAQAVLREPAAGTPGAAENAAARQAWAGAAVLDPGRYERGVRWAVIASDAYATDGPLLGDQAILAIALAAVDALATAATAPTVAATASPGGTISRPLLG